MKVLKIEDWLNCQETQFEYVKLGVARRLIDGEKFPVSISVSTKTFDKDKNFQSAYIADFYNDLIHVRLVVRYSDRSHTTIRSHTTMVEINDIYIKK